MSKKEPKITVTVKTVPHPNPQRAIDLFASLVLKEIERQDAQEAAQ